MKPLRIVLGFHLLFFAGWGTYLLTSHQSGQYIWLETLPVDPRDYLSGNYVALNFNVGNISKLNCPTTVSAAGTIVYVHLRESGQMIPTSEGNVRVWSAVKCQIDRPIASPQGVWMEGYFLSQPWGPRIQYGIERFYVSEGNVLRNSRSGEVIAKVSVNSRFKPRIVNLVKILKR